MTCPLTSTMFSPPKRYCQQLRSAAARKSQRLELRPRTITHEHRHRRIGRQGQGDQQIPGLQLQGAGVLRARARPAVEGRLRRARQGLPDALGRGRPVGQGDERDRRSRQECRQADPGHRPRPRGRGHLLAHSAHPGGAARPSRRACPSSASPSTPSPSNLFSMRSRRRARSTRRWWTPTSPAGRSTISSASRSRRCCGASCRAPARPAACSRWPCASSATARPRSRPSRREEYWTIEALLATAKGEEVRARLTAIAGKKLDKLDIKDAAAANAIKAAIEGGAFTVASVEKKAVRRNPYAPFTTSTLQQEASRKLGFSAKQTMNVAQRLYEGVEHRRRGDRPHHLHANRRRDHHSRGGRRDPQAGRARLSPSATCRPSSASTRPRPRTPRRPTRRSARPTCGASPRRSRATWSATRPASTS